MAVQNHIRNTCSSPVCRSICLIQRFRLQAPAPLHTSAISSPFPTGRKADLRTRLPLRRTPRHLKPGIEVGLAFWQTRTAPLGLILANVSTLAKSLRRESTTTKSTAASAPITSSASPTTTSGEIPARLMAFSYSKRDRSSGTTQTCLPHACLLAMVRPRLVAESPPRAHASTMSWALEPAAMAESSSAALDPWKLQRLVELTVSM